jgi:ABC-type antimicrobial peptide transport system permease subunit
MFTHFFKTAFRFFWRNKSYTILNYLCLTLGLTFSIVAALNIKRAVSYDRFHKNYERLYEVVGNVTYFNGDQFPKEQMSASLPDLLASEVPEIDALTRVTYTGKVFATGDQSFNERGIYADTNFLSMFTFPLSRGVARNPLEGSNSILITERLAIKLFKSIDCAGKSIVAKSDTIGESYIIKGVLKDIPSLSYLQFDFILPISQFIARNKEVLDPGASSTTIWALMNKDASITAANGKVKDLILKQESTLNQQLFFFPLREKILYSYAGGRRVWSEMQRIVIIGLIGFFILLIACFNFINLSIALNMKRYREAGIKKVVGANRFSIIFQHLGETTIITLLSLFTSLDLVRLVLNVLNRVNNASIQFDFTDLDVMGLFAGVTIFAALASGLLPALYLASAKPVNVLKGSIVSGHSFSTFRKSLIIFQFTIPVILIIFMLIVRVQDNYFRKYDLGFDKSKLLIIPGSSNIDSHSESIRNELLSLTGIKSVSYSTCIPAHGTRVSNEVSWEGKDPSQKLHFWCISTDYDYSATVNIKMTNGRYFDKSYISDSSCYVINDVAARVMNYTEPVGRTITLDGKKGIIIGVFKDFHALDLAGPYTPTVISISKAGNRNLLISLGETDYKTISGKIREIIGNYDNNPSYQANLYSDLLERSELTGISKIIGIAFLISIILACLGLSGLASFTAASRTKEIGIRKINGGTILSILRLLGLNYTRWLIIASCFAIPIAFMLGNMFLARFNFRTSMPYWAFIAGPVIAYLIALLAVGVQSWRAATRNPVESLRYE